LSLVSFKEMLKFAKKGKYAVGCFNIVNMESLEACVEASVELNSPVILSIAQVHLPFINFERMVMVMQKCAQENAIPVVIMMDHAYDFETVKRAVNNGVNAVMYDISTFPLNQHIEKMKEIVEYCHSNNVFVEGELGYLSREIKSWDAGAEKQLKTKYISGNKLTSPEETSEYIIKTGVDALAVSIGNSHGLYTQTANINFDILTRLNEVSSVPLVLHGSSGISDEDLKEVIHRGINKINYYTGFSKAAVASIRNFLAENPEWKDYHPLIGVAKKAMKKIIYEKIKIFGSAGKA